MFSANAKRSTNSQNTNMTIVVAGGVVSTHSGASRLLQWLVFGSSLALGAAFLLRETASGMRLRFQCRWPAVSVRAVSLALRALMALRLRLSWSHRRLMFTLNSSRRGLWSSHALRWKGAGTRRWFHTGALWQEVANGLRLLLRFKKALRECFHRHSEKTWGIHGKGCLLRVLQLVQSQPQVTI